MRFTIRDRDVPAPMRRACSGYSGQKFRVDGSGRVTIMDTTWSGGTRCQYWLARLADGATAQMDKRASPKPGDPFGWIPDLEGRSFEVPPGFCVVEHSIFCGKDMGIVFHVHPGALAPLLPQGSEAELDERELAALAIYNGIKSAYREQELKPLGWSAVDVENLARRGLLKVSKNGATGITVEGKNVVEMARARKSGAA